MSKREQEFWAVIGQAIGVTMVLACVLVVGALLAAALKALAWLFGV